ncbi:hypothetical protein [Streptomyces sp. NPDC088760]|uniref:hypothetical protein n=1 Tax=Streptomyces sp. NPDC088760 TaxID=3365890 RepID=UPI0037F5A92D
MTKAEIVARLSDYLAAQPPSEQTPTVDAHRAMFVSYWQQAQQLAGGDTGLALRCAREAATLSSLPGESAEHAAARHAALPTFAFGDHEVTFPADLISGRLTPETVNPMWNDKVAHFFASAELAFAGPFEWLSADGTGHGVGVGAGGATILGYAEEVLQLGHNAAHAIGLPVAPHFGAMDPGDLYVNGCGAAFGADAREHAAATDILRYLRAPDEDDATAPADHTPDAQGPPDAGPGPDAGIPSAPHRDAEAPPPAPPAAPPDPVGQVTLGDGVWADRAGNWHPVLPVTSPQDLSTSTFTKDIKSNDVIAPGIGDLSGATFTGGEFHLHFPGVAGPAGIDDSPAASGPPAGASFTTDHMHTSSTADQHAATSTHHTGQGTQEQRPDQDAAAPAAQPERSQEQAHDGSGATFTQAASLHAEHTPAPDGHALTPPDASQGSDAVAGFTAEH